MELLDINNARGTFAGHCQLDTRFEQADRVNKILAHNADSFIFNWVVLFYSQQIIFILLGSIVLIPR